MTIQPANSHDDTPPRLPVVRVLPAEPEAGSVMSGLVRAAREMSEADAAWMTVVEGDRQRMLASDGEGAPPATALAPEAAAIGRDAVQGARIIECEVKNEPWRSLVAVPITGGDGEVVGALCLASVRSRHYSSAVHAGLRGIADGAAAVLAQAREYRHRADAERDARAALADSYAMLEHATDLVLDLAPVGTVLGANRAAIDALGGIPPRAELAVVEEQRARLAALLARVALGETVSDVELVLLGAQGRRVLAQGRIAPRAGTGGPPVLRAVLRDVTAEHRTGSERERLLNILGATTDIVAVMDVHARLTWLNATGRRHLGISDAADVTGIPFARLYEAEAYDPIAMHAIPSAIASGSWSGEVNLRAADGRRVPASQVIIAHESARGGVWFLSSIVRDMTERQRVEDNLRESEARFRRLSDASRDGIAVITDGRVSDVNYAFTRLFGWDELEAHGLPAEMLWEGGHRERVARYLAGGLDGSIEVPGRRKQGGMFDLEISATQVTVEGRVAQVLVLRDISGRKEVDRMKRDFIATVSHELRTPLTSIRGSLGLVQGAVAGRIDAQATRLLAIALDNAERLTRLVNDILDLEKIEAGKLALTLAQVRMGDLVHAASEGVRPLATAQQVEIRVHPVGELRAVGDRDRLLQVLTNYLSNAIRFSPVGSTVTVRVEVADAGTVRCAVEDRGPGISAVDIPRLFQRFTQLDNARDTKVQGGTGLGLAISRSIVEQHRGRVGVESTIGVGTVFWFEIPAVVSTITDEQRGAGVTSLPHPKPS